MKGALLTGMLLCLPNDPVIERVDRIMGPFRRPWLWCPLAVTISSRAGFRGDLTARSSLGFDCARRIEVAPGGRIRVILPALDPLQVAAGPAVCPLPVERSTARVLVAVDGRLSWAAGLTSTDRILYRVIEAGDLKELLELGLMEAFDLLLLSNSEGLALGAYGTMGTWKVVQTSLEAPEAVAALGEPPARFGAVDTEPHRILDLAPREIWVPAQRVSAAYFAGVYLFAVFAVLVGASRRGRGAVMGGVSAVAFLFVGIGVWFFPRGRLWIVEYSCEVVPAAGPGAEWKIWFAGSGTGVETEIRFPLLVKPVFPRSSGAEVPFVLHLEGRGSRVEGLRIPPGGVQAFVAAADRAPSVRPAVSLSAPLFGAVLARGGRFRTLGDLPAGGPLSTMLEGEVEEGPPLDPALSRLAVRFVRGESLMGRLERGDRSVREVSSPDVADARGRPRLWVGILK